MNLSLADIKKWIVDIWRPAIDSQGRKITVVEEDIDIIEGDIEEHSELIEENTEEILATKDELQEVKDLLILLIQDLAEKGLIDDPRLLELLNEEILI